MEDSKLKMLYNVVYQDKDIPEKLKQTLMNKISRMENQKVNLLITGATGCGKSSTINALFDTPVAKVGCTPDPETMSIEKYEFHNLVLWDSPGLGDGEEADKRHAENIIKKLKEVDANGDLLIDAVLVIVDGSSRDLGTSYKLINEVIIPYMGSNAKKRILIAINQADLAMKGRYWNYEENKPEQELINFLEKKVVSVQERIKKDTGIDITPIYYSAGFKEDGKEQTLPWNLSKLLYYILTKIPKNKRWLAGMYMNKNEQNFKNNQKPDEESDLKREETDRGQNEERKSKSEKTDRGQNEECNSKEKTTKSEQDKGHKSSSKKYDDYNLRITKSFFGSLMDGIERGKEIGEQIGGLFGEIGKKLGGPVGAVIGGIIETGKRVKDKIVDGFRNFFDLW